MDLMGFNGDIMRISWRYIMLYNVGYITSLICYGLLWDLVCVILAELMVNPLCIWIICNSS